MRLTSLAGGPPHQGNPSARGELTLNNVAAGEYLLTASLPGYTTEERPVTLPFGAVVDLGDLVLRHDSDGGAAVVLRGEVRLADADVHAGTTVRVRFSESDTPFRSTLTDAAGRFEVPASRDETYALTLERADYVAPPEAAGPFAFDGGGAFHDPAGAPPNFVLQPIPLGGRITATVRFAPAWVPEEQRGGRLRVVGPHTDLELPIDESRAVVIPDLPAGQFSLAFVRAGFESRSITVELDAAHREVEAAPIVATLVDLAAARLDLAGAVVTLSALGPDASFRGADLAGATLAGDLTGLDLRGANLSNAHLPNAHLDGADLSNAMLFGAELTMATFVGADLQGASLQGVLLTGADFSGADLSFAQLNGAFLGGPRPWPESTTGPTGRSSC